MRQEMAGEGDHAAFVAVGEVAMRGFGLHRGADSVGRTVQDDGTGGQQPCGTVMGGCAASSASIGSSAGSPGAFWWRWR